MRTLPFRLTLIGAALAGLAAAAHGQTAPDVKAAAAPPKVEIKAAADAYNARRDDTATRIVVNRDEIAKYGDTNILDVLKRLPGITVAGAGMRGGEIRMRGLGAGYTQILIDGERAPGGFAIDTLAPDAIERIEILRAATADMSTQSIAGTINIVLRKSIKTGQRDVKLGLFGGDGDKTAPNFNVQVSDKKERLSYSLGVNGSIGRFARPAPTWETRTIATGDLTLLRERFYHDRGESRRLSISPRLQWTFANGDTLTSQSWFNLHRNEMQSHDLAVARVGEDATYPWALGDQIARYRMLKTDLNWVRQFASGAKLDVKGGGSVSRQVQMWQLLGYSAPAGHQLLGERIDARASEHAYSFTGKFSAPVAAGHSMVLGWDTAAEQRDDSRIFDQPLALPVPLGQTDEGYSADIRRLSAFAQDEWTITPRWSVYLGLRWDGVSTAVSGNVFVDVEARSGIWSPVFQTLYKLPDTKGDQLRFALTRTYKAPSTHMLVPRRQTSANNGPTELDFQGNPDLKPETAIGFDAGYEHYWEQGAMVSANVSLRELDDYTRNATRIDAGGRYVMMPVNQGTAQSRSLELEAKFPLKALFANAPAVDLRASMSRNWSRVDAVAGPDNRMGQQTPFSATVGADYKAGAWTTGASFSYRSVGLLRLSATESTYGAPRRDLEAYALWKFDPRNQLRLSFGNMLGRTWHNERIYTSDAGTFRRIWRYDSGPTARLALELKY